MLTRFQTECSALYSSALADAMRLQHAHVGVEHVALASLSYAASPLTTLKQIGLDPPTLMRAFEKEVGTGQFHSATAFPICAGFRLALDKMKRRIRSTYLCSVRML